jgi:hypothetical protein
MPWKTLFEDFESKTCFVQVLDCHNLPRRAITRHGKQNGRPVGLLATNSQWRVNATRNGEPANSQWRVKHGCCPVLLVLPRCRVLVRLSFMYAFIHINPSNKTPRHRFLNVVSKENQVFIYIGKQDI